MATVKNTIALQDKMTPVLRSVIKALQSTVVAMSQIDGVSNTSFNRMKKDVSVAEDAVNKLEQELKGIPAASEEAGNSITKLKNPLVTLSAAFYSAQQIFSGIGKITGLADEVSMTTARLNLMNDGLQTTEELQRMIFNSANAARSSYMDTAAVVSKLGILAGDAFSSNEEMVLFAEQMNKQFKIGGASVQEQTSAMYQLTQAMAAGKLQGDEFRAIMENAPLLAQAIADFTGKSKGELKEMSAEGTITADIIKSAMFAAMDQTNAQFETLPMTFAQSMTVIKNNLVMALQPILTWLSQGAAWIAENWENLVPIFLGVAGALAVYAAGMGIAAIVTWVANGAAKAFFATLLTNPVFWIALAIGVLIGVIYKWIQSVGGLKVAWAITSNYILIAWNAIRIAFMTGVYFVLNLWDNLVYGISAAGVAIANYLGDMKANVLTILQNMVNGAIGIINDFISILNKIPGVSIEAIAEVTFGTTAQLENEAAKQARNDELAAKKAEIDAAKAERDANIANMQAEADASRAQREADIAGMQVEAAAAGAAGAAGNEPLQSGGDLGKVGSVGKIEDDVSITDDDIKLLKDVAATEFINKYTTLRPEMTVSFGDVRETADIGQIMGAIETMVEEAYASSLVNG